MSRGTIVKRPNGRVQLQIDVGKHPCQQCIRCRRRFWTSEGSFEACPKCGGELRTTIARRRETHSFKTKRQAERARTQLLHAKDEGTFVVTRKWTVREYLERWLDGLGASDLKPSTIDSYERNLRLHVITRIGHLLLQALTPEDLSKLYADLLAGGRRDGNGGLSRRSVHYIHTIVGKALSAAVDSGYLVRNPADRAVRPQRKSRGGHKGRTWSAKELRTFLNDVLDDQLYPAFLLAATTGMRRGEICGLQWRDLDLEQGRISISRQLVAIRWKLHFEPTTKTGRGRTVDLDERTVSSLSAHRMRQGEQRIALGLGRAKADDLVFTQINSSGDLQPLHPESLMKTFRRRARRAGVPVIRFHDLRHTWATLALQTGVPVKVVQERLGHSSVSVTLDIYTHVAPGMQKDAAEAVASRIFGA